MLRRSFVFLVIAGAASIAATATRHAWSAEAATASVAGTSPGLTAITRAADRQRYAYVLFWKVDGEPTQQARAAVDAAMAMLGDKADAVIVCAAAPEEKATVDAFKVARAPMPLVLAVAPNGAVTKAWPADFRAATAAEGIVSAGMAACLKPLQEEKLVLLTVHNANTASAGPALEAAAGFLADSRFAAGAAGVEIDPADPSEAGFLADLKVSPTGDQPVTVLLAPPGKPVATFTGAVTTAQIIAAVTDAKKGCCPDGKCGPGECCPGGKCGPTQKPSANGASK
jgi:hypothetical protein